MESKQTVVVVELTSSCVPPFDWIASDRDEVEPEEEVPECVFALDGADLAEEPEYEYTLGDEPECVFALSGAEMEDD